MYMHRDKKYEGTRCSYRHSFNMHYHFGYFTGGLTHNPDVCLTEAILYRSNWSLYRTAGTKRMASSESIEICVWLA